MMLICRTDLFCSHMSENTFAFIHSFIYLSKLWEQYLTISQKTEQCGSSASTGKFHWSKSGALEFFTTAAWNILINLIIIRPVIITAVCSSWPFLHTSVFMNSLSVYDCDPDAWLWMKAFIWNLSCPAVSQWMHHQKISAPGGLKRASRHRRNESGRVQAITGSHNLRQRQARAARKKFHISS